jgi:urease gamma subunit
MIAPAEMSNEEIDKFKTNLREVMLFIKYSKDKNKLNELLTGDEKFKSMDRNAAEVINTVTGSGLKLKDKEDTIDMCKAIEDMMNDSRSAANIETALRMLEKGKYSIDEIAELVELPIEKVQELSNHKAV